MSFPPAPLSQDIPEEEGSLAERIETPHDHDVLAGRGNFVNYHPGNEHFRGLVRKHKVAYVACPKPQKGNFSKLIFDEIKSLNPPGRFLKQDAKTKLWYEIPEKKALDKTRQALREGAPEIHKELTGEVDDDASPEHCRDSIGSSDFDSPVKLPGPPMMNGAVIPNFPTSQQRSENFGQVSLGSSQQGDTIVMSQRAQQHFPQHALLYSGMKNLPGQQLSYDQPQSLAPASMVSPQTQFMTYQHPQTIPSMASFPSGIYMHNQQRNVQNNAFRSLAMQTKFARDDFAQDPMEPRPLQPNDFGSSMNNKRPELAQCMSHQESDPVGPSLAQHSRHRGRDVDYQSGNYNNNRLQQKSPRGIFANSKFGKESTRYSGAYDRQPSTDSLMDDSIFREKSSRGLGRYNSSTHSMGLSKYNSSQRSIMSLSMDGIPQSGGSGDDSNYLSQLFDSSLKIGSTKNHKSRDNFGMEMSVNTLGGDFSDFGDSMMRSDLSLTGVFDDDQREFTVSRGDQ